MKRQMIMAGCALGLGLSWMAATAQAGYVVSNGQYFDWVGANGITTGSNVNHFDNKTANGTTTITAATVGGQAAAQIVDNDTTAGALLAKSYAGAAPTDNNYTINFSFYASSFNANGGTGNPIIIREMSGSNQMWAFWWGWNNTSSNPTGFAAYFGGSGAGILKQGGSAYFFPYNSWIDVSIQRTSTTSYALYVTDSNGGHDFGTISDSNGNATPSQIQVGPWSNAAWTSNVAYDKVLVGEVPEPASLALLALGGLLVLPRRRRA